MLLIATRSATTASDSVTMPRNAPLRLRLPPKKKAPRMDAAIAADSTAAARPTQADRRPGRSGVMPSVTTLMA